MFRYFLIKILFLQILTIFNIGNANLAEELSKLQNEIFEIGFYKELYELQAEMRETFKDQILREENFAKIYNEIREKIKGIFRELNEKISPKMVKSKAKLAERNVDKILYFLMNEPFLMVHPEISQILKAEYSILQWEISTSIAGRGMGESSKSGAAKGKEIAMEIVTEFDQKMEELEKLVNLATVKIQTMVTELPQLNGFGQVI